jgi:ribonuclease HI
MDIRQQQIEEIATKLDIRSYDLLLIGDGSGTQIGQPCGWFATLYESSTGKVREYWGGASSGTNNFAELQPYIHALWSYHTEVYGNEGRGPARQLRVVVVSDSELTVKCGTGKYVRKANGILWAAVRWLEDNGYVIAWKHVPRNSNDISMLADKVAGKTRLAISHVLS